MDSLLFEISEAWSQVEKTLSSKAIVLSYDIHRDLTFLLEAWNAATVFATHEHDKQWKAILSKQLKQAKKIISKTNASLVSESLSCLKERVVSATPNLPVFLIFYLGYHVIHGIYSKRLVVSFDRLYFYY